MASYAAHAIEIETDDGAGNLVSYTNAAIGASSGKFYLITDRFGLDGSKTIAGDTDQTTWYEGLLTKDYASFSPSRSTDFVESGDLSAASSFSFSIKNTAAFWNTLEANEIYLGRCRVTYYYVTSTDGITFTFTKRWTGIIEDQPFGELAYKIQCIDNSKDIFGSIPPEAVDVTTFPRAQKDSLGKPIPVAIGRVSHSPMVNVNTTGQKTNLTLVGSTERTLAAATAYSAGSLTVSLYTLGKTFAASDLLLVGRFLVVVLGGARQARKILSNTVTASSITVVALEEALEESPAWVPADSAWAIGNDSPNVWYFEVVQFSTDLIASTKPISEFLESPSGLAALYTYSTDEKDYTDVSEAGFQTSTSNVNSLGYPGARVIAKSVDPEGNLNAYFPIYPESIKLTTLDGDNTWDGPGLNVDLPNLTDKVQSTYYQFDGAADPGNVFELTLPTNAILKDLDDVYLLVDFSHRFVTDSAGVTVQISAKGVDFYGRPTEDVISAHNLYSTGLVAPNFVDVYTLPGIYYQSETTPSGFYTHKASLSLSTLISNLKDSTALPTLRVTIAMGHLGSDYQFRLKEIGLVGKKAISLTSETVHTSLVGETFGTRWRDPAAPSVNRKTSADPQLLLGDALEGLIRKYDYNHPIWQAGYTYKAGERVRSTVDNGLIYICTVAGTSHASVEPTFPTTLTSTVTDGTVTWTALDTLKIHCGSFDTLATQRATWFIGRTLTEKKKSEDYYRELARQGFFGIMTDAHGRVKVKSWVDNRTPTVTFSSTNVLKGSIGEMRLTPMRRVYNDFLIRYDWNPASGNFNRQIFVTHVDEPEFPGTTELLTAGTSMGSFTVELFTSLLFYLYFFTTPSPHGLATGDYVYLTGNTHGYDFGPQKVSVASSTTFTVEGFYTATTPSTTGTLYRVTDTRLKWQSFVGGVTPYGTAKGLWDQCHASYVVSKSVQKLPQELGDCYWFIDPAATDPSGNSIWTDLAGAGNEHPAYYYAMMLADWVTWQKKQITIESANDATNRALELFDPVYFNDTKLTNSVDKLGWIHEITDIPGQGPDDPDRIRFGITFNPDQLASCTFLYDTEGAADTITDTEAAADTITDQAC